MEGPTSSSSTLVIKSSQPAARGLPSPLPVRPCSAKYSTHHHGSHVPRQVPFVPGILASDTVIGQVQAR